MNLQPAPSGTVRGDHRLVADLVTPRARVLDIGCRGSVGGRGCFDRRHHVIAGLCVGLHLGIPAGHHCFIAGLGIRLHLRVAAGHRPVGHAVIGNSFLLVGGRNGGVDLRGLLDGGRIVLGVLRGFVAAGAKRDQGGDGNGGEKKLTHFIIPHCFSLSPSQRRSGASVPATVSNNFTACNKRAVANCPGARVARVGNLLHKTA